MYATISIKLTLVLELNSKCSQVIYRTIILIIIFTTLEIVIIVHTYVFGSCHRLKKNVHPLDWLELH